MCPAQCAARPLPTGSWGPRSARFLHVNEDSEPDWLAELAKGGEALRRQAESIVQAAEQFVSAARRAMTKGGPVPPFQQRVVRAVEASLRELRPVHRVAFYDTGAAVDTLTVVKTITGSGGVTLPPMSFSGQGAVENRRSGLAERSLGQILALVVVAIATSGLLGVQGPDRATVDHYLTVIAVALAIAWRICDKRK